MVGLAVGMSVRDCLYSIHGVWAPAFMKMEKARQAQACMQPLISILVHGCDMTNSPKSYHCAFPDNKGL